MKIKFLKYDNKKNNYSNRIARIKTEEDSRRDN